MPIDRNSTNRREPIQAITATQTLGEDETYDTTDADSGKVSIRFILCTKDGDVTFAAKDTPTTEHTIAMSAGDQMDWCNCAKVATSNGATLIIGG